MRMLLGIIIGGLLTIGGAYVYDSQHAGTDVTASAQAVGAERPLVNWDVASVKWHELTGRARTEWHRLASR